MKDNATADRHNATADRHREAVATRVDSGGCTETWAAMAEMRTDASGAGRHDAGRRDAGRHDAGRRDFVRRVGLTIGAIPLIGATSSATASTDEPETSASPIRGTERDELIERANESAQRAFVVEQLEADPAVEDVFEYTVGDDDGVGITYGDLDEDGPSISYYESDAFPETSVKALGGRPVEGGSAVQLADGEREIVTGIYTEAAVEAAEAIPTIDPDLVESLDPSWEIAYDEAILSQAVYEADSPFDVYVPVVENDDVVARFVGSGYGSHTELTTVELDTELAGPGPEWGPDSHVACDPFGFICTDYCSVLCSALAGLSGAACLVACSGTIAGIPISPSCAAICTAVVGGTCYPTCVNLAH